MAKPKNIVICLDGTGNQIEENLSNVLKLYRTLEKSDTQLVYYDQGVGTLGQTYTWGALAQKVKYGLGLAFGLGLDDNVIQAYEFIVRHHQDHKVTGQSERQGDNIYIFGFSRGAHTARVLAGLIYEVGILSPDQIHLSGAALTAYKQARNPLQDDGTPDEKAYEGSGANFRRVAGSKVGAIKFMGVWDTVSSVFVPNSKGRFPPITGERLPHTALNPAVETFRHAIAVDEFRKMYRVDHWQPDQVFKPNIHSTGDPIAQDASEVWFAGCHSDVGGGYKRKQSGLSQFPLIWMLEQAKPSGLKVSSRMAKYVTGVKPWTVKTKYLYPKPDVKATLHKSLKGLWWIFELLSWGRPRPIDQDAIIHETVKQRMQECPDYRPKNLP